MQSLRHFKSHKLVGALSNQCSRFLATTPDFQDGDKPKSERCHNRVTLLGRIGKAGEIRGTSENPCVVFPLATNIMYRKAATGEVLKKTDWHRICVFRPGLRDIATSFSKGDRVFVGGSLSYQKLTDNNNNVNFITSILADEIIIVTRRMNRDALEVEEEEDRVI